MLEFKHLIFAFTDLSWIYQIQKDSFVFDLWRNRFKEHDDETEIKSEIKYVSSRKTRYLWLCNVCSFLLSLWNMTYKFFMNKHDLINKSWEELQSESLEKILADVSWDERIKNEKINES